MAVDAVGSGMYIPFSLVFFQHVTRLPLPLIGAVLTATGFVAMAALPLVGAAVDHWGAKRAQLALYLLRAVGFAAYPLATVLPLFAAVALVTAIGDRGFPAAQQARIGELVSGPELERLQGVSRSLTNAGLGIGTLLATGLIAGLGDAGFLTAAWLNAGSFLVAALLNQRVPGGAQPTATPGPRTRRERGGYRLVLADRPYLGLTAANFLVALGYSALSVLLPAFAANWLGTPQSLTGSAFALNTALCAVAGVPAARLVRRFGDRTRAAAAGAVVFAVAFLGQAALGLARPHSVTVVMTGLLAAVAVATLGELLHSPALSALSTEAAPQPLRGRYLATYQLSWSLSRTIAPSLFTLLLAVHGSLPWLFVAATALASAALLLRLGRSLPADAVRPVPVLIPAPTPHDAEARTALEATA
ncbi:MFS transporter [Streptacidiphilus monticola]